MTVDERLLGEKLEALANRLPERLAEVEALAPRLLGDKDAAIVTYCSNTACPNSGVALAQLRKLGYTNVRKYAEGRQDWEAAGLPLAVVNGLGWVAGPLPAAFTVFSAFALFGYKLNSEKYRAIQQALAERRR